MSKPPKRPRDPNQLAKLVVSSNLTMRMHMRHFTRLTNAFSKKVENHAYAVALHTMYYNFVRITSAMAAGVSDRLWEIGDIVALVEKAVAASYRSRPLQEGG
jgi:hypothetical protein